MSQIQSGGVFERRTAYRSASTWVRDSSWAEQGPEDKYQPYHCSGLMSQPLRTKPNGLRKENSRSPSEDQVDRSMRTLKRKDQYCIIRSPLGASTYSWTLKLSLEPVEVTNVSADQRLLAGRGEVVPESIWSGRGAVTEGIRVAVPFGVVPSDLVGDRVDDLEVVCKGTGGDLVIVSRVTPSTEPAGRGVVEDRCVGEVGAGICQVEYQHQPYHGDGPNGPKVQSQ